MPECKGLPLEIVDRLFEEKVPFRNFQRVGREYLSSMPDDIEGKKALSILEERKDVVQTTTVDEGAYDIPAGEHGTMRA